jgi:CRP/FNR family transcriptional regulator, cyclic AMP receptor protein
MQRRSIGSDGPQRLAAIQFFDALTEAERRMVARLVEELDADTGDELMREGDFGYEVVIIEDGAAEVNQGGVTINAVGPGDVLGELAVLDAGGTRTATVVATQPLRGIVLTSHFMHHVREHLPAVAEAIDAAAADHRERDRRRAAGEPAA